MTTEEAAFRGIVYGGLFTLAGTAIASIANFAIQRMKLKWELKAKKTERFSSKRMVALQGCVKMIDFLISGRGKRLGSGGIDIWHDLRTEALKGAYLPKVVQDDYKITIREVLFMDDLSEVMDTVDVPKLEDLRSQCILALEAEYGSE